MKVYTLFIYTDNGKKSNLCGIYSTQAGAEEVGYKLAELHGNTFGVEENQLIEAKKVKESDMKLYEYYKDFPIVFERNIHSSELDYANSAIRELYEEVIALKNRVAELENKNAVNKCCKEDNK